MWFVGLVLGALLFGSVGGLEGAAAGAVVGLVAGAIYGARRSADRDDRLSRLEDAIARLEVRIEALEQGVAIAVPRADTAGGARAVSGAANEEGPPAASPATAVAREPASLPAADAAAPAGHAPAPRAAGNVEALSTPVPAEGIAVDATARATVPAGDQEPVPEAGAPSPVMAWLLGGNTLVRVGVVILFFGVAFLLKYAAEHVHVPIELRLGGVAAGGIVLLVLGWRLRERRAGYALALQGGGVGLLYLTIFAAFRLYGLMPPLPAFVLLVAVAAFSAILSVVQDARSLAVAGAIGGFLAPLLASTGTGSHVMLFGYYLVLNAGILAIALHRSWRVLNLVGFVFTFLVAGVWGAQFYRPDLFASTEPFLVAFFLMYVAIAVLFARREAGRAGHYVDGTLVFGTPLVGFLYQARLVRELDLGAALSAAALGLFYLVLARALHRRANARLRMLTESFLALGICFATLAIPLAADGRWTSAAWALEGAAILWVGVRQGRMLPQAAGIILQPLAGVAFLLALDRPATALPLVNSLFVGGSMVALGGLFCAWMLTRRLPEQDTWRRTTAGALLAWGFVWWCGNGLREIDRFVPAPFVDASMLAFLIASCCAASLLHRRLGWAQAGLIAYAAAPIMALAAGGMWAERAHPFAGGGWLAWPFVLAAHLWLLARHEHAFGRLAAWYHASGVWALAVVVTLEAGWLLDQLTGGVGVWRLAAWGVVPAALIGAIVRFAPRSGWPLAPRERDYLGPGLAPVALHGWVWLLVTSVAARGDPAPLPFVPVLNPLELAQLGVALALIGWVLRLRSIDLLPQSVRSRPLLPAMAAISGFVWLNGALLRALHHLAGVPHHVEAMARSTLVQTACSIFWTLIALAAMVIATRRGLRAVWMTGAALMSVVVAKLFFVDLANVGGIERIVSFIGVGLLMLLVGYLSPVPPRAQGRPS